jgi:GntR family transcriptional repressor for pyruvate dehydrogenase complex
MAETLLPPPPARRRSRSLALALVDALGQRIRDGRLAIGDKLPTESAVMAEFGVSRTVVREAISRLQAAGLVETRHGIGTFVLGPGAEENFRIVPEQMATILDVIAVLELRMGLEAEAAALAAKRHSTANLQGLREAQAAFGRAIEEGSDTVAPDVQFHMEIARATQNPHYAELMGYLGTLLIPRARLDTARFAGEGGREYLLRVQAEHDSILAAISNRDVDAARAAMRTHLWNSRERLRRARHRSRGER